jgi:hypothetical protein
MDFRENLMRKIAIDDLSANVIRSLKDPDSGIKFDRDGMHQLLAMGPYRHQRERDLDLYVLEKGPHAGTILVLDNGLAIYRTSIEDVVLRKSPTVKEMVNITNAIKILSDKDVVLSRKAESVQSVVRVLNAELDLTYTPEDIAAIARAGRQALEGDDAGRVEQNLRLFAELLGLTTLPRPFRPANQWVQVWGRLQSPTPGGYVVAPVLVYNRIENILKLLPEPIDSRDSERMEVFRQVLDGDLDADVRGRRVFDWLEERVLAEKPVLAAAA